MTSDHQAMVLVPIHNLPHTVCTEWEQLCTHVISFKGTCCVPSSSHLLAKPHSSLSPLGYVLLKVFIPAIGWYFGLVSRSFSSHIQSVFEPKPAWHNPPSKRDSLPVYVAYQWGTCKTVTQRWQNLHQSDYMVVSLSRLPSQVSDVCLAQWSPRLCEPPLLPGWKRSHKRGGLSSGGCLY